MELHHPEVAYRDCKDCRVTFYNEKGERVVSKNTGKPLARTKPPPCDTDEGCPKGHWSKQISVSRRQLPILRFYDSVQATCGACMTEEQKGDQVLLLYLRRIHDVMKSADRLADSYGLQQAVIAVATMGKLTKG